MRDFMRQRRKRQILMAMEIWISSSQTGNRSTLVPQYGLAERRKRGVLGQPHTTGNSNSLSADLADLDGDARVDIVAVNINLKSGSAPVEIWLNKPLGCSLPE
jgi:hypothetical protein